MNHEKGRSWFLSWRQRRQYIIVAVCRFEVIDFFEGGHLAQAHWCRSSRYVLVKAKKKRRRGLHRV